NWLHCDYGRELRSYLWAEKRRVEIHTFAGDADVFPDARVGASLVAVGPAPRRGRASLVFVDPGPTRSAFRSERDGPVSESWGLEHREAAGSTGVEVGPRPGSSRLTVRRGIATGANSFFLLTDLEASRLPGRVVVPAI